LTLDKIADTVKCRSASYRLEKKQLIIDFKLIAPREYFVFMCMYTSTSTSLHYKRRTGLHIPTYNLKYNRDEHEHILKLQISSRTLGYHTQV
jgi:hypothetical protein